MPRSILIPPNPGCGHPGIERITSSSTFSSRSRRSNTHRRLLTGAKTCPASRFPSNSARKSAYIELKLKLAQNLKKKRLEKHLTQIDLAKLLKSNQSRVAKMEAGDPSVSIDLLIKSLLALGTSHKDLAGIISQN